MLRNGHAVFVSLNRVQAVMRQKKNYPRKLLAVFPGCVLSKGPVHGLIFTPTDYLNRSVFQVFEWMQPLLSLFGSAVRAMPKFSVCLLRINNCPVYVLFK